MRLLTRLQALESKLRPAKKPPPLRIVLVDNDGRWWKRDGEIDPESIDLGTRVYLLRHLAAPFPRCA